MALPEPICVALPFNRFSVINADLRDYSVDPIMIFRPPTNGFITLRFHYAASYQIIALSTVFDNVGRSHLNTCQQACLAIPLRRISRDQTGLDCQQNNNQQGSSLARRTALGGQAATLSVLLIPSEGGSNHQGVEPRCDFKGN